MVQRETTGMQGLALKIFQTVNELFGAGSRDSLPAPVHRITNNWMIQVSHVNPYLMGSAGVEFHLEVSVGALAPDDPIMAYRALTHLNHRSLFAIHRVSTQSRIDGPASG